MDNCGQRITWYTGAHEQVRLPLPVETLRKSVIRVNFGIQKRRFSYKRHEVVQSHPILRSIYQEASAVGEGLGEGETAN